MFKDTQYKERISNKTKRCGNESDGITPFRREGEGEATTMSFPYHFPSSLQCMLRSSYSHIGLNLFERIVIDSTLCVCVRFGRPSTFFVIYFLRFIQRHTMQMTKKKTEHLTHIQTDLSRQFYATIFTLHRGCLVHNDISCPFSSSCAEFIEYKMEKLLSLWVSSVSGHHEM